MKRAVFAWLYALVSAAIAGAANGLSGALGGPMFAPNAFNPDASRGDMIDFALFMAVVGGIGGMVTLLKQSPLPDRHRKPKPSGGPGPGGPTP